MIFMRNKWKINEKWLIFLKNQWEINDLRVEKLVFFVSFWTGNFAKVLKHSFKTCSQNEFMKNKPMAVACCCWLAVFHFLCCRNVRGCGLAPRLSQRTLGARGTFDSPARSVIVEIVWSTDATFAQAFARSKRATRIAWWLAVNLWRSLL